MYTNGIHVLVVDDEPHICSLVRDGLRNRGVTCETFTNSTAAKRALDANGCNVLVADVAMPGATGLDLLAHARRRRPNCRVILITGLSSTRHLADALALGAYEFFQKPLDINALLDSVTQPGSRDARRGALPLRAARALREADRQHRASLESAQALVHAVEAKDPYTRRHSEHVAHYATHLGEFMGLPRAQVERGRTAALLHDIGKIGVPDHILTKPGELTEEEFAQVRRHPVLGAEILRNISAFENEAKLVRHHHENWDGSGYPDGLARERMPLGARIINVGDSIDAMLMERTYKRAYPLEQVIAELERCAGTQFDPAVADQAVRWLRMHPRELVRPVQAA